MQKEILSHTWMVILKLPRMYKIQISRQVNIHKGVYPLKKENTRSHFQLTSLL